MPVKERWQAEMSCRGSSEAVPRVRDAKNGTTAENRTFELRERDVDVPANEDVRSHCLSWSLRTGWP